MDGDRVDAGTSACSGCRGPIPADDKVEVAGKDGADEVDDEDEDDEHVVYVAGPFIPLKEQIEKDKDDECDEMEREASGLSEYNLINDRLAKFLFWNTFISFSAG